MTPASYIDATWRATLPFDTARERVGVAFTTVDGTVVRLALDRASAKALRDSLRTTSLEAQFIEFWRPPRLKGTT